MIEFSFLGELYAFKIFSFKALPLVIDIQTDAFSCYSMPCSVWACCYKCWL